MTDLEVECVIDRLEKRWKEFRDASTTGPGYSDMERMAFGGRAGGILEALNLIQSFQCPPKTAATIRESTMARKRYYGDYRCEDGRMMRHSPQSDDPYLETDVGECESCGGKGCPKPDEEELSKPVLLCSCGKVLESPAKYAAHCAEFPSHFTQSAVTDKISDQFEGPSDDTPYVPNWVLGQR